MSQARDGPPVAFPLSPAERWRGFGAAFSLAVVLLGVAAIAFVAAMDPYGLRAASGRAPGALMDANQRFLYPQIIRAGRYDAAVFGTSTARLLDPQALGRALGGRFANLAMNAATPWEQTATAQLFLREAEARGGAVRGALFALDATWCEPDADRRRGAGRPFPGWLYEDGAPLGTLRQVNWQALAVAGRVMLHRLGRLPERIRGDGYAVFTPPEAQYDAARATAHIHAGGSPLGDEAVPAVAGAAGGLPDAPLDAAMPALDWLDGLLARMPAQALRLVAFMPVHAAAQALPGTARGAREAACKARVAAIGRARRVTVVDFRIASPVTTRDANYWDALHYRLPVADRIVAGLAAAQADGRDDPDGFYRVLAHP